MTFRPIAFVLAASLLSSLAGAITNPSPFPFDARQLSGVWTESISTAEACAPESLKKRMTLSPDGKRIEILYDRVWNTPMGDRTGFKATVLSATARTLVIRYDGETRFKRSGLPLEWELAVVAPGIYRWRETDWKAGDVNVVVGIRCGT